MFWSASQVVVSAGYNTLADTECFCPIFVRATGTISTPSALFRGCVPAARILLVPS